MSNDPLSPTRPARVGVGAGAAGRGVRPVPPRRLVGKEIQDVFKRPIEVKKVSPSPVKGLCEVQVSFQGQPNILYTDTTGAHFVIGHLIEAESGKDLTEETLSALNSLSPEDLKKVDALVAMTVGTKGKAVYFVTDPM